MKYMIMDKEEAKKVTGWKRDMDHEYRGVIPGYFCGYNFEVTTREGKTDFFSCTFSRLSPDDLMNPALDWYSEFISDMSCKPTGRVIFRGYYIEGYDPVERDNYYEVVDLSTLEVR